MDQHCHPVVLDPLDRGRFELLLTEARDPGPTAPASSTRRSGSPCAGGARPCWGWTRTPILPPTWPRRAELGPRETRADAAAGVRGQRPAGRHRAGLAGSVRPRRAGRPRGGAGARGDPDGAGGRGAGRRRGRRGRSWAPPSRRRWRRARRPVRGVQDRGRLPRRARPARRPHPPRTRYDAPRTGGSPGASGPGGTGWTTRRWSRTPSGAACRSDCRSRCTPASGTPT